LARFGGFMRQFCPSFADANDSQMAYSLSMHIPDGFIDLPTSAAFAAIATAGVAVSIRGSKSSLDEKTAPLAGLTATFIFAVQMLNFPVAAGTSGHLLGAAGAIEAIACVMSVVHDIIPPTINHFTDDPELDNKLNFTFNKAQKRTVNVALSNTFGFGGHNTSIIVKKFKA
jgi:3-oxoacyl-[acyl-carrier-protein] synthase II